MNHNSGKRIVKYLIIISIIIATVVLIVQHVLNVVKKEKIKEMQADLLAVQAKVEIMKGKNNFNKDENPLKGISVSKIDEKIKVKSIFEKHGINGDDVSKFYVLRDSDLSEMDLQELVGKNSGSYIVNYDNYEVIYTEGFTNANGLFCYKVSEMNKQPEVNKVVPVVSNNNEEKSSEENKEENKQEEKKEENKAEENKKEEKKEDNNQSEQKPENAEEKYNAIKDKWKNLLK